jgi:hypothetical protein
MAQVLGDDPFSNPQNSPGKPWLTGYLLPLGSVLIAALTFLTQNIELPKWAVILATLYLVVVAGVSLYDPIHRLFSFLLRKRRLRGVAKSYLPLISDRMRELRQLVGAQRVDTLVYVLEQAAQWEEIRSQSQALLEPEHVETMRSWLSSIEWGTEQDRRGGFFSLCRQLSDLIHRYNRFCCQRLRILQELVAAGRLPEQRLRHLKQQWNLHREAHVAFIREWQNLSQAINGRASVRLCPDYYESLGTLE